MQNKLYRVREVAEELGFSTAYIYELIATKKLKGTKVGVKAVRVAESDLRDYIRRQNRRR